MVKMVNPSNLPSSSKGNALDRISEVRIQSGISCHKQDTCKIGRSAQYIEATILSKSPSDTHATACVSIVEKCVQIKQILPTVCSATLKIFIVCLDTNKEVHLCIVYDRRPQWSIGQVGQDSDDNSEYESVGDGQSDVSVDVE